MSDPAAVLDTLFVTGQRGSMLPLASRGGLRVTARPFRSGKAVAVATTDPRRTTMTIRHLLCALSILAACSANAQVCSGGAGGGMDATGNQCNEPERNAAEAPDAADAMHPARRAATVAYESGHYARAAELFRVAAEQGDVRSAEALALMHRFRSKMYGAGFATSPKLAGYWAAKATEGRSRTTVVKTQ